MKFAEHLLAHITPEWRKQYINYEEMKAMLYLARDEAPSPETVDADIINRHFTAFDELFFHFCDTELKKINTFYSEKLAEATRKYATLVAELKTDNYISKSRKKIPARKFQELKLAFSEYYLSLILLQNYQNLNFTGFRKILKKHDKILSVDRGVKWRQQNVETSPFYTNKYIDKLITDTENTVTTELEAGDRQKAMKRLRVPPLGEQQTPWTTFKVGLFSGSFIVLLTAVVLSAIFHEGKSGLDIAIRLYRGPFLIVELIFLLGVNVYGWRSSGVNHVLIFELDPRNHISEQDLMEVAAVFGVIWTLSVLSFLYSSSLSVAPYVNPLALTIILVAFMVNPVRVFRYEARFWAMKVLGRIIAAPFFHVTFADFWLADQLNSLAPAFLDFHYLICFYSCLEQWVDPSDPGICSDNSYIIRPLVNCLPAWFRFAQCIRRYYDTKEAFPHLANAAKYSTTFFVVMFNTFRQIYQGDYESNAENPFVYLWVVALVVSSCYTYTWDIKMDWGLFDAKAGDNKFLREEIVYSTTRFYYFAIVEDFVLRFAWVISLALQELGWASGDHLVSILSPLEVARRFIWNFFRLENEHLNNCGKFRAVRDISVAPLDSSDAVQIIKMMDDENGVVNRKKRKPDGKKIKDPDRIPLISNLDSSASSKSANSRR